GASTDGFASGPRFILWTRPRSTLACPHSPRRSPLALDEDLQSFAGLSNGSEGPAESIHSPTEGRNSGSNCRRQKKATTIKRDRTRGGASRLSLSRHARHTYPDLRGHHR